MCISKFGSKWVEYFGLQIQQKFINLWFVIQLELCTVILRIGGTSEAMDGVRQDMQQLLFTQQFTHDPLRAPDCQNFQA